MIRVLLAIAILCVPIGAAGAATPQQTCIEVMNEFGLPTAGCAPKPRQAAASTKTPAKPKADLPAGLAESHVFFPKGGSTLDRDAMVKLAQVIQVLQTGPMADSCIKLVGHSDSSGAAAANQQIGLQRAQTVAAFLRNALADPARVRDVASRGEDQPLPDWPSTDRMNRRVAIWLRHCP